MFVFFAKMTMFFLPTLYLKLLEVEDDVIPSSGFNRIPISAINSQQLNHIAVIKPLTKMKTNLQATNTNDKPRNST